MKFKKEEMCVIAVNHKSFSKGSMIEVMEVFEDTDVKFDYRIRGMCSCGDIGDSWCKESDLVSLNYFLNGK